MHFTIKPVSFVCNLKCDYCFYLPKGGELLKKGTMSDEVLEAFIKKYIEHSQQHVFFTWQGGEPLLAGHHFYERVIELQNKYAGGKTIENAIQTNGTLIDERWCEFFKQHKILIGISIDGPEHMHDVYRKDPRAQGSFTKVMRGIELLKKYHIPFNTLTCINQSNYKYPLEVYQFLKDLGSTYMQFSEVVETIPENCDLNKIPESYECRPFSLPANEYGNFMGEIFKVWVKQDIGRIVVRQFESFISRVLGTGHLSCVFENCCPDNFVIEANGDIYECDQLVYPKYRLGNILNSDLATLHSYELNMHKQRLSSECRQCKYLSLCNGGCVKHRINMKKGGPQSYFCEGYKQLFKVIIPYLNAMVYLEDNNIPYLEVKQLAHKIENIKPNPSA